MEIYLVTILAILSVSAAWVIVQRIARAFSGRHPELGPHREEGTGCCGGCVGACHKQTRG